MVTSSGSVIYARRATPRLFGPYLSALTLQQTEPLIATLHYYRDLFGFAFEKPMVSGFTSPEGEPYATPPEVREAVKNALLKGYRHIDTALAYGNEAEVGAGIKDSGVPREEIWITTKLDNPWHARVPEGIDSSLKDLGVDYVDLYLVHWPSSTDPNDKSKHLPDWDFIKTWYVTPERKPNKIKPIPRTKD